MNEYEVDRRLGYSPCVCGFLDGTWHPKCYQEKVKDRIGAGKKNAYVVAKRLLKSRVAATVNRAILRAMAKN